MTDASGTPVTVTLGGKTTLRFQYANQAGDFDYLAFVPTTVGPPKPQITKVSVATTGAITIEWTGGGTLQATPQLTPNAVWQDITGATSPLHVHTASRCADPVRTNQTGTIIHRPGTFWSPPSISKNRASARFFFGHMK